MIQCGTRVKTGDNSGIKWVRVIYTVRQRFGNVGHISHFFIMKKNLNRTKLKKHIKIRTGVVINLCRFVSRLCGTRMKFSRNRILMLRDGEFFGTRVYGFIARELFSRPSWRKGYKKIISYARGVV